MIYEQMLHDLYQRGGYRHWCIPKVGGVLRWWYYIMQAKGHARAKVCTENGKLHTMYRLTITGYNIALHYDMKHFPSPRVRRRPRGRMFGTGLRPRG